MSITGAVPVTCYSNRDCERTYFGKWQCNSVTNQCQERNNGGLDVLIPAAADPGPSSGVIVQQTTVNNGGGGTPYVRGNIGGMTGALPPLPPNMPPMPGALPPQSVPQNGGDFMAVLSEMGNQIAHWSEIIVPGMLNASFVQKFQFVFLGDQNKMIVSSVLLLIISAFILMI